MYLRKILYVFLSVLLLNINLFSKNIQIQENEITGPLSDKPQPFDVLHYDLFALFDNPPTKHIVGTCKIYLKWLENQHENKFFFHLRSLSIDSAFYDEIRVTPVTVGDSTSTTYHHEIITPIAAIESDTHVVRIHYSGIMTDEGGNIRFGGVSAFGTSLFSLGVGFSNNYISATQHWMPCYDHPMDKATFQGLFAVPFTYFVASNGLWTDLFVTPDNMYFGWTHKYPCSTYLLCFAADQYGIVRFGNDSLPVEVYARNEDTTKVRFVFKLVPEMVEAFEKRFGKYPFEKVSYALTRIGSMEHQTMISYTRDLVNLLYNTKDTINFVAAHELAHQWFGDMVTCRDFRDAWLNESFATFCESIWYEDLFGYDFYLNKQGRDINVYIDRNAPNEGVFPLYDFPRNPPSSNYPGTIYHKGSAVLGMLRYELGDEIFFQAIREYLNRYKYSNANTSDLKNVIEDISGKNLDWFFKQWVYGKGWPKLNIKVDYLPYDDKIGKVYLDIQQTQISDYGKYTNLPLEFGFVLYNDETIYRIIKMTDEEQDFWLDSIPSFKNVSLNYGPSVRVLLELNSMISSAVGNYFAEAGGMKIYPNPAYSEIHLAFFRNVNKACISVYNMFGEKVLYQCILFNNNDESLKLDVSHLPTGIYNVSVLQNGMIMNTKIQIVK